MQRPERLTEAILLSGFLGSGKTTLLKHILSWKEDLSDTVVILNEFGEICIDGSLIDRDVKMVELVNGCICCTLQLDLRKQIETLVDRFHPRWLMMESTGLADTGALVEVFAEYAEKAVLASYRMAAVIDVQVWPMRHLLGPVFHQQLAFADLILLNKIDTMDLEAVRICIGEISSDYPRAAIVPTSYCKIDPRQIQGLEFVKSRPGSSLTNPGRLHESAQGWTSFAFIEEQPLDEEKFKQFIRTFRAEVFRMKGLVRFPDRVSVLNHVNGASEWIESAATGGTKLVVIGRATDMNAINQELKSCIINANTTGGRDPDQAEARHQR
jgi:G3E family GTPase